ncbi:MAG TPA: hypothetical protein VJN71_00795 [Nitrososphaerales archaeon]|nr:hypothetical protein [Nitrososphaerales archaeon]
MTEKSAPISSKKTFEVKVTMNISQGGKELEARQIDFGSVNEDQLKALTDLFSTISTNVDAIRSMAPLYERLDKTKPSYLK